MFFHINVGFKGVYIARTYFHDEGGGPNFQVYNLKRNLTQFRPAGIQTEEF